MEKKIDGRQYKRVSFKRSIKFKMKGREVFLGNLAQDISQSGVRCISSEFLATNAELTAQVQLKEHEKIMEFQGRVKWVRSNSNGDSYQVGVEFFGDNQFQRSIIAKFIETL